MDKSYVETPTTRAMDSILGIDSPSPISNITTNNRSIKLQDENELVEVNKKTKEEIDAEILEKEINKSIKQIDDFIQIGYDALIELRTIASSAEDSNMYNVMANTIKALTDAATKKVDIRIGKNKNKNAGMAVLGGSVTQNINIQQNTVDTVVSGTTNDLAAMIEQFKATANKNMLDASAPPPAKNSLMDSDDVIDV